ncbi:MAG TPA: maltose alpha-D-glucosyltransferase [Spirochaetota bacterium]|nr:maltose alpha-D-glucosyltransferase [Spirochaetota bacterium]HRZ28485.1 maltose alpha-D-glucosyltransferase [Spirochaetota bacterium]HSA15769.1 maltose alpha-D-glucosyltransferase [Spirochaetota bacterium]
MENNANRHQFWYKHAVIYELYVRGFKDSNRDGRGDLRGLISRLDYLVDLGIDCIWLMPVYPSPGKDDGYDIMDYCGINPEYGAIDDFRALLEEAHKRGLKIIGELVLNHTSDQHEWFQSARSGGPASPYFDYYVWSETPDKYREAAIIFSDTETSNWTYCKETGMYYWHRFFYHQPDLNYDNPKVRDEMIRVIRFWLDMGLDGFRVDAVPYLFEREGTNCENLAETHEFIKKIRALIEAEYPGSILLAEANQWPEDLVKYFGDGDQFHMAFNFPLMPRLFMSLKQEHHGPIVDIMKRLPKIPHSCQWAMFLRNHDEMTLEMVTDEERDYMFHAYAEDRQMRINKGIRRRLAPLLGNDRKKIELLYAILLTLPGTPVIYYGDEIGMGDNIYLGDRNGVRTPMHWNDNKNAGFSDAQPSRLYAPVITDPVYNFNSINVEEDIINANSLFNWLKNIIHVRKNFPIFGNGTIDFLYPENKKILAYLIDYENMKMLCVFNLAHSAQPVEIDLQFLKGRVPIDIIGGTVFPPIGELPYFLTPNGYGYYIFHLTE